MKLERKAGDFTEPGVRAWGRHVEMPLVDPETMAWLVRHVRESIGETELASLLDVEFRELGPLRRCQHVDTFVQATGAAYSFFSPDEPARLVRRLLKRLDGGEAASTRSLPLPVAARERDVPLAGLISAILDGRLRVAGTSPKALGLSRIRIDADAAATLNLLRWQIERERERERERSGRSYRSRRISPARLGVSSFLGYHPPLL
ncbi:hypothetical protein [Mesorhizobium carmichaelinearum]|uniref:hypothetical protein n=1 Tax=Mesorhizobium carmichaelinearum TaxID=1208188 RepID=UPI00117DBE73|nr:hypothetical protein [Mesorhizobium carmichaelinearum]